MQSKVSGLLGLATKAGKIAFGIQAVIESIEKQTAKLVVIAKDTSEGSRNKIQKICEEKNVTYIIFGSIEENSIAIGKFNKAVIAIKDNNFADAILKIINGGDTIE